MSTKNYWVGDRPAGTWVFQVLDQKSGAVQNLTSYTGVSVLLLDPQNKTVDIPDGSAIISDPVNGTVTFFWPTDTLFNHAGRYVMQLELSNASATRRTTVQEILVRKLGGKVN